jgi:hypothetical protein
MGEHMSFLDIINEKITGMEATRAAVAEAVQSPQHHRVKCEEMVAGVLKELEELEASSPMTKEQLMGEMISVLNQLPSFVQSVWTSALDDISVLDAEMARWIQFRELYNSWYVAEERKLIKQDISTGVIKEPTKEDRRTRKIGTRPPMSLREYRNLSKELESAEDSET